VATPGLIEESVLGAVERHLRLSPAGNPSALAGGVWACEVPEGQPYPFCEILNPRTELQYSFEGLQTERPVLQLVVSANSAEQAETLGRKLSNTLLDGALPLSKGAPIQATLTDMRVQAWPGRGPDAKRVFAFVADFLLWVAGGTGS
jgi:hypothetical protein